MNKLVRRIPNAHAVLENGQTLPARRHHAKGMAVESQLEIGIEPRLRLAWAVLPDYWDRGYSLLVFRSAMGFSAEKHPKDLNTHGQLFIDTSHDANHEECPAEGTHYFTFVLHKKSLLGLVEKMSVLRFSETVPSAKVALGRIPDQIHLRELMERHDIGKIEYEAKLDEAKLRQIHSRRKLADSDHPSGKKSGSGEDALIAEELASIDAIVGALHAKREKLKVLRSDPRFRKLNRKERQTVKEKIEERLDAAEISARREMKGNQS